MKSAELRKTFLSYFEARGHTVVPSASLVAAGDPTLLFVNAGMVPFKDVFLGKEKRSYTRAASVQKCLRVSGKHNDLEEVGPSSRHHTFFEMLGNFSFGDYFKEEALEWSWEFLTRELGLPPERLHPTVFEEDDESARIWSRLTGRPASKIVRLGPEDNFWAMGDTGPCGPNSEIIYDRTGKCLVDGSDCPLTHDCDRWWELWNNVFMQFDRAPDGTLTPLAQAGVDTGMGFERLCAVTQGVASNYETDLFAPLIDQLRIMTDDSVDIALDRLPSYRAIADHARAVTFLLADGIMPSNDGSGYVLRRILRRASYHGQLLGLDKPFLPQICDAVVETMGAAYPEIREASSRILSMVADEEGRFLETLETGLVRLERALQETRAANNVLPGDEAFRLYDTYGFPIDLTRAVLEAHGWSLDEKGFQRALEEQRERGREAHGEGKERDDALLAATRDLAATRFTGYETLATDSKALLLRADGGEVDVVLDVSPFYAEGGGQVGDSGRIAGPKGEVEITSVRRLGGVFVHSGRVVLGQIGEGDAVRAEVDESARRATMSNHTATHLLHKALRLVLGPQAKQAGSLVAPDRLRFDFLHGKPLTDDELHEVERLVREQVLLDRAVRTDVMPVQEALKSGADAMFDEKYGEEARVVSVGNGDVFSRELCGGTHCHATGEIGAFFIVEQRSVGAGVRRVEAVTGFAAFEYVDARRRVAEQLSREYNAPVAELVDRIRFSRLQSKVARKVIRGAESVLNSATKRDGTYIVVEKLEDADEAGLRKLGDDVRERAKSAAVVLGSVLDEKLNFVVMLTPDLVEKGLHAGKLAKQIGNEAGGGGGGRPDVATAGGEPERIDAALAKARELLTWA